MKKLTKLIYLLTTFSFLTLLNGYLSNFIVYKLQNNWHFSNSIMKIIYVENTGAAFSIMQDSTTTLVFLSFIAILGIFYYLIKNLKNLQMKEILFFSFLISGIFGNSIERIVLGHVRDFFDLNFINFPIFNISDIFINIGVIGIIIFVFLTKNKNCSDS